MDPQMTETAAVPAPPAAATRIKMTHEARLEKKRAYMAAKYLEPQFRAAKRLDMVTRYHARVPDARYGVRGRRPSQGPTSEDEASAASTPRSDIPAAGLIVAGAALGVALAALL